MQNNKTGKLDIHMQNNKITPPTKMIWKWIKELNRRPETVKLLEDSIGKKLLDIGLTNDFQGVMTKAKINKGDCIKQKILQSKSNNQQNEKATYRMRTNIC